jgi:hypothetical protein
MYANFFLGKFQMLVIVAQSIPSTSSPGRETHIRAYLRGLQVQLIVKVAFDCILFGKYSLTNRYT